MAYEREDLYLVITFKDGKPWEVFANHAIKGNPKINNMLATWDMSTRFITMSLKRDPLEKTIRQLHKSSRSKKDLPGILKTELSKYLEEGK